MEVMHWVFVGAGVAAAGAAWYLLVPHHRGWKPLNDRMSERVTQSAALVKECTTTMGCATAFGRFSTIR
jgi:hypothetical protein